MDRSTIEHRVQHEYIKRVEARIQVIRRHAAQRNWPGLRTELTRIRKSSGNLGFPRLQELARAAEQSLPEDTTRSRAAEDSIAATHSVLNEIVRLRTDVV